MAGINRALFENRHLAKASAASGKPCICLSHISVDKPAVQAIATSITSRGDVDIYLDAMDDDLLAAASSGNAAAITAFIERGPSNSTAHHVLSIRKHSEIMVGSV